MQLELVAFGKNMPAWVDEGFQEYASRLPRDWKLILTELALERRGKNSDQARIDLREAQRMRGALCTGARSVALAVEGERWSTEQLADKMSQWNLNYRQVTFLIGGPEGLPGQLQTEANEVWSLSPLTLPHPLVRVVVAEQLYRAWSILNGLPYHRGC
ncbi:MAG TPA: 23S rRNA (pseudouridine(1915)-N(3))-methyltransferase RlmH [Gammaproteobacteria bacterium]|nr:23S rRNA (pseudouridine(1915)-N(3))-methyltransferase RlmH [Gammaproteobacteria bacterium]